MHPAWLRSPKSFCRNGTCKSQTESLGVPQRPWVPLSAPQGCSGWGASGRRAGQSAVLRACWKLSLLLATVAKLSWNPRGCCGVTSPSARVAFWYSSVAMTTKARRPWETGAAEEKRSALLEFGTASCGRSQGRRRRVACSVQQRAGLGRSCSPGPRQPTKFLSLTSPRSGSRQSRLLGNAIG